MTDDRAVHFLFPGHGSESVDMTRRLYEQLDVYRDVVDGCFRVVDELLEFRLADVLFPEPSRRGEAARRLSRTIVAQPALFTVEYSLARLLTELGIEPSGMLGHSVGEYVAACLAGVFELETALEIVVKRGQLVEGLPRGKMLAVALSETEVRQYLNDRIDLGSTLGERHCVVSGYPDSVDVLRSTLRGAGVACSEVRVDRAFHSMMLDPVLKEFEEFVGRRKLHAPKRRFVSGVSGTWMDPARVQDAAYWVEQLRSPVRFFEGVGELAGVPNSIFVEVGGGAMLTSLVQGHPMIKGKRTCVSLCPAPHRRRDEVEFLLETVDGLEPTAGNGDRASFANRLRARLNRGTRGQAQMQVTPCDTPLVTEALPLEGQVTEYFIYVLGNKAIGVDQNFLEAGGNSLMAMQVIARIRKHLGVEVPLQAFFERPTIRGVSKLIMDLRQDPVRRPAPAAAKGVDSPDDGRTTSACDRVEAMDDRHSGQAPEKRDGKRADVEFSLFFFSGDEGAFPGDRYKLVMEGAQFADKHHFDAVWIPERHFNPFGGLYPNPSVLGAAIAAATRRIHIRGGSVVAPLHHPVRIAEEWSVVDNLSKGRIGIAFGSGFHPNDFLLAPAAFAHRKVAMLESIAAIRSLWQGGTFRGPAGDGREIDVKLLPRPYSGELPIWLSTTRSPDTFEEAGTLGSHVLTALLRLSIPELRERIALYRAALERAGHDPRQGVVTVMLHTFVGPSMEYVRAQVEGPLKAYLRSHMEHTKAVSRQKIDGAELELTTEDEERLLEHAFQRYFETSSLIGTEATCLETIRKLKEAGVDEVACLIDFGVEFDAVMASLPHLNRLRLHANEHAVDEDRATLPAPTDVQPAATDTCPLSSWQQRIWFLEQLEPNTSAYNLATALRLNGRLDASVLEDALREVVTRQDALRVRIRTTEGRPVQVVSPRLEPRLHVMPLDPTGDVVEDDRLDTTIQAEVGKPFDVQNGPLFRATLIRLSDEDHILLLVTHHLISDGWSLTLFKNELIQVYGALCGGAPIGLAALPARFFDFCRQSMHDERSAEHLDYWRGQLSGVTPLSELATDFPRPRRQTFKGAEVRLNLPDPLVDDLKGVGREYNASLFVVVFAAFQVLLFRYTGTRDFVVGLPVAGRGMPEFEDLIGLFANTLPFRARWDGDATFAELVERVRDEAMKAFVHQDAPLEALIEEFETERDLSRSSLFQVMFAFQNFPTEERQLPGIRVERFEVRNATSVLDIALYVHDRADGMSLQLQYNPDLFRRSTMVRMLENFRVLLTSVAGNPSGRVSALPLLADQEREQLLHAWNRTDREFDGAALTHERIEATAQRMPDRVAAIFPAAAGRDETRMTFRELSDRSSRLARHLITLGVGPEVVVGICMERTESMLVGLLGTLKAGGAYLPLDATLPEERQRFMLQDAGATFLLTDGKRSGPADARDCVVLDLDAVELSIEDVDPSPPQVGVDENSLAYIIYTSGSTGRPKGVAVGHGALANFLMSMLEAPGLQENDLLLGITTLSFDIAALELFLPLVAGACVVIAESQATSNGQRICELLLQYKITVMQGTPSTWRLLLECGWEGDGSTTLLCGGEPLDSNLAGQLLRRCRRLWNLYGPTETTIWSSRHLMRDGGPVLIGRPIENTTLYVLDGDLNPMPIGFPGDLYIGGRGVARGYVNRPELTDAMFIRDPFGREGRLYRTGDRARWHEDGQLECLGRLDRQVKFRGYRIELGEIEAALSTHPDVVETAVIVRGKQVEDQRLVAFVVRRASRVTSGELQDHVGRTLPEYMIPSSFAWLERLPKTVSGKTDPGALPDVDEGRNNEPAPSSPPMTTAEKSVAAIWSQVLGLKQVELEDNFFRIGGHSLTSIQLISRVNREYSVNLPVLALFENPTLETFCRMVESVQNGRDGPMTDDRSEADTTSPMVEVPLPENKSSMMDENILRGIKNRFFQLIARAAPNALRTRLHRWRGVRVGKNVGIGYDSIIETSRPWLVSIGDRSRIGMRVTIIGHFAEMEGPTDDGDHPTVRIAEDVWIGPSVTILPNVSIGRGSVVAAGSVVNMTIPPGTFAQGNPAKPVAHCRVPLTRHVTYDEFIKNLVPIEDGEARQNSSEGRP